MGEGTGRIDWNDDEVDLLCLAAELMQTNLKNLMRQKNFDIPVRDAAVRNLSLLHQAQGRLGGRAPSMPLGELAALYGALLLLRDTLREHSEGSGGRPQEEAACLERVEPMGLEFAAVLKKNGIEAEDLVGGPKPRRKGGSGKGRNPAEK